MKKALLIALALSLVLLTACQNPPASGPNSTEDTTESVLVSDSQSQAPTDTDPPETSLVPENAEPIRLIEGDSILEQTAFCITINQDGNPVTRVARMVHIKNQYDRPDFYMDVLNEDGIILCHQRWMGYGQIIVEGDNPRVFHVLSVGTLATDPDPDSAFFWYATYEITNVAYESEEPTPLDRTAFREITGLYNPLQPSYSPGNYYASEYIKNPISDSNTTVRTLLRKYNEVLTKRNDRSLRVVFDTFTDPTAPILATPEEQIPCTMEEHSVLYRIEPYTIKHICELLGLRYRG